MSLKQIFIIQFLNEDAEEWVDQTSRIFEETHW